MSITYVFLALQPQYLEWTTLVYLTLANAQPGHAAGLTSLLVSQLLTRLGAKPETLERIGLRPAQGLQSSHLTEGTRVDLLDRLLVLLTASAR